MTTDPADGELVPLGDGPGSTVLAGVDGATGEAYAVKVLPERLDRRTRAGLDAELRALAGPATEAPILVADRVVDLGDGRQGLRMELCSQSLPELIEAFGPLSVADSVALGTALAEALAAAHRAGVLHGGVTPGNVLFRGTGEPVLADFGLTLRRAFPADPARTLDFLAPETLRDGTVDERSDLYGLGAILHLALTGGPPHAAVLGEPEGEHLLRVLTEPVPPVPRDDLPPVLAELVAGLLAKDPAQRPVDAAAVAGRLAAVGEAGTGPVAPQPAGEPLLVFGPRRRSRLRVAPGLAAGVVLVAVATLLFWLNQPDDLDMPAAPPAAGMSASAAGPSRAAVLLELADVTDRGDVVDLAWRSSEPLSFAILLAAEDGSSETILAQRATTFTVPVDPVRKYCFLVQGTNGVDIYTTAPKPIRGAVCKE
jgi:hypothetical protein